MTVFWIVVVVLAVAVVAAVIALSGLVRRRKRMDAAWVAIDSELRYRHDLVSSLLNTVLAIAPTKDDILASVAKARREAVIAGTSGDPARISSAENAMNSSLRTFFEATQHHPMLSSAVAFTSTRDELRSSADRVLPLCEGFNAAAKGYDSAIGHFPRSLVARAYGFGRVTHYRVDEVDRNSPAEAPVAGSLATTA